MECALKIVKFHKVYSEILFYDTKWFGNLERYQPMNGSHFWLLPYGFYARESFLKQCSKCIGTSGDDGQNTRGKIYQFETTPFRKDASKPVVVTKKPASDMIIGIDTRRRSMKSKEVLLVLTDRWADWEAAYVLPEVNSVPQYMVKTIAVDKAPKVSIGGIRVQVDCTLDEVALSPDNVAMLILPGGFAWGEDSHSEIAVLVRKAIERGIPVAAICGATLFLARQGILDKVRHTGDAFELFANLQGYHGHDLFQPAQVVVDQGIITANETAAVEFASRIFRMLAIDSEEEIDDWYDQFQNGMFR